MSPYDDIDSIHGASRRVAVVGAGHAGLCVVASLNDHGMAPLLFEPAGRIGDRWRHRYRTLRLNTDARSSAIPGHPPSRDMPRWPTGRQWADYLERAASTLDYQLVAARVERIELHGEAWAVTTDEGTRLVDAVVVATGRDHEPYVPHWRSAVPTAIECLHSSRFDTPHEFAGRRVIVVGSGNSATEIARLLTGHAADVAISVRTRPRFVKRETVGVSVTQIGRLAKYVPIRVLDPVALLLQRIQFGDLDGLGLAPPDIGLGDIAHTQGPTVDAGFIDAVRNGDIEVVADIAHIGRQSVTFADHTSRPADVIIAATGYRTSLDRLVPRCVLDADGWPIADTPPFRAAPGLYFAGFAPATLTAFMPDFAHDLPAIALDIARLGTSDSST